MTAIRSSAPAAEDATIAAIEAALTSLSRRRVHSRLHDHLAREAGVEIDQAGLAVLGTLFEQNSSLRVTDVAARLNLDLPSVTRKAQHLERQGLVGRSRDAADARASRLQLTPGGRQVICRFLQVRHQWFLALLADWPAAERQAFARMLTRFTRDVRGR